VRGFRDQRDENMLFLLAGHHDVLRDRQVAGKRDFDADGARGSRGDDHAILSGRVGSAGHDHGGAGDGPIVGLDLNSKTRGLSGDER
jgi:hypothetical protein